jgi:alkylation response protein AidB-like acyl-CoA dehydrogenase
MDLDFTPDQLEFRDQVRTWLDENKPTAPRPRDDAGIREYDLAWQRTQWEGGWAGIAWPTEYGGKGLTLLQQLIWYEEYAARGFPGIDACFVGNSHAGPTLITRATDEQKSFHLPKILGGEVIWCQGFSEPDAGSDLAAVKTRAVRDGEDWVVTGQKVWTSGAQYSKWCMLVARTDADAAKHKGLSYFLMDMDQAAVEVRPLRQITGESEFNELFIDGARIPHENLLGGEGNGWKVALTTLMNERAGLAFFLQVRMRQLLDKLIAVADQRGLLDDPIVADRLGELHLKAEVLRLTAYRGLTAIEKYGQPGPEGSLTKWMWSQTNQELTQLAADLIGPEALTVGSPWAYELLRARGNSIEGGTTEVLKNIVAERVLGLPKAR